MDFSTLKHIHFIGIGGAGMGGIAEVLLSQGFKISGSDVMENAVTRHLNHLGAKILRGHRAEYIEGADLVVVSSAIPKSNPEVMAAQQNKIPIWARAQMLAQIMQAYNGIAIAGTHGKTTTTGLITALLTEAKLDPTFVIGGLLVSAGTHAHLGKGEYFVAEADESDASFLFLSPKIVVITNIDVDHLNNYTSFDHLKEAFLQFIHRLPEDGLAVLCSDDPVIKEILNKVSRPYLTYGFQANDAIRATEYTQNGTRCQIKVAREKHPPLDVVLNLPGRHNVLNALAAIAIATHCNVNDEAVVQALERFQGTGRRFQIYGELNVKNKKVLLIDDYGHHPREIAATIESIRNAWPNRRLVLAFQPHRYSRTQAIFNDFVQVLSLPDALLLLDIYSAGEAPIVGISGKSLWEKINKQGKNSLFVEQITQLPEMLAQILQDGDVLLIQGAGDIGQIAPQLAQLKISQVK